MNDHVLKPELIGKARISVSILLSILATAIFFCIYKITPRFFETVAGLGVDLPTPTLVVLKLYPVYPFIIALSFLPSILVLLSNLPIRFRRAMLTVSAFALAISVLYFIFTFWAMYLPALEYSSVSK